MGMGQLMPVPVVATRLMTICMFDEMGLTIVHVGGDGILLVVGVSDNVQKMVSNVGNLGRFSHNRIRSILNLEGFIQSRNIGFNPNNRLFCMRVSFLQSSIDRLLSHLK